MSSEPDKKAAPKPRAAERILETARELFYRRGIQAVGVDEIVSRAGVTKPSLYRNYPSKDELAAAYLREYDQGFWARFDAVVASRPGDPRAQIRAYFETLGGRHSASHYRGCAMTNTAVEYPESESAARAVSVASKRLLRQRLRDMAEAMGAADPDALGDGLLLLFEGANVSAQIFGEGGPARSLAIVADRLIEASLKH